MISTHFFISAGRQKVRFCSKLKCGVPGFTADYDCAHLHPSNMTEAVILPLSCASGWTPCTFSDRPPGTGEIIPVNLLTQKQSGQSVGVVLFPRVLSLELLLRKLDIHTTERKVLPLALAMLQA